MLYRAGRKGKCLVCGQTEALRSTADLLGIFDFHLGFFFFFFFQWIFFNYYLYKICPKQDILLDDPFCLTLSWKYFYYAIHLSGLCLVFCLFYVSFTRLCFVRNTTLFFLWCLELVCSQTLEYQEPMPLSHRRRQCTAQSTSRLFSSDALCCADHISRSPAPPPLTQAGPSSAPHWE